MCMHVSNHGNNSNGTQNPPNHKTQQVKAGLALFLLSELGNLICHVMLSRLRPADGTKLRPIPTGFLFELVSCPNYFFEVSAFAFFGSLVSGGALLARLYLTDQHTHSINTPTHF